MLPKAISDRFMAREKLGKEAITSLKQILNSLLAKSGIPMGPVGQSIATRGTSQTVLTNFW